MFNKALKQMDWQPIFKAAINLLLVFLSILFAHVHVYIDRKLRVCVRRVSYNGRFVYAPRQFVKTEQNDVPYFEIWRVYCYIIPLISPMFIPV